MTGSRGPAVAFALIHASGITSPNWRLVMDGRRVSTSRRYSQGSIRLRRQASMIVNRIAVVCPASASPMNSHRLAAIAACSNEALLRMMRRLQNLAGVWSSCCLSPRFTGASPFGQPAAGYLAPLGSVTSWPVCRHAAGSACTSCGSMTFSSPAGRCSGMRGLRSPRAGLVLSTLPPLASSAQPRSQAAAPAAALPLPLGCPQLACPGQPQRALGLEGCFWHALRKLLWKEPFPQRWPE